MRSACFYYDIFYLQPEVTPLKIALGEIFLPKITRHGTGIRVPWVEIIEKLISMGRLLGIQEYFDMTIEGWPI